MIITHTDADNWLGREYPRVRRMYDVEDVGIPHGLNVSGGSVKVPWPPKWYSDFSRRRGVELVLLPHQVEIALEQDRYREGLGVEPNIYMLWHRRAGKDFMAWLLAYQHCLEKPNQGVAYILPYMDQAEKVIWKARAALGSFLDLLDPRIILDKSQKDKSVTFLNGSKISLGGTKNVDALVGTGVTMVVFSEFALGDADVRDVLAPTFMERKGRVVVATTYRGFNHAWKLAEDAKMRDTWLFSFRTVGETKKPVLPVSDKREEAGYRYARLLNGRAAELVPVVTEKQILEARTQEMSIEMENQEWWCKPFSTGGEFIFGAEVSALHLSGRVLPSIRVNPSYPVRTFWDFGLSAGNQSVVWVAQWIVDEGVINILYYHEWTDRGIADIYESLEHHCSARSITVNGPVRDANVGPWDLKCRDLVHAEERVSVLHRLGIPFRVVPRIEKKNSSIDICRRMFGAFRFSREGCSFGLERLAKYRRTYDEKGKVYGGPRHDGNSNAADALQVLALYHSRDLDVERAEMQRVQAEEMKRYGLKTPSLGEGIQVVVSPPLSNGPSKPDGIEMLNATRRIAGMRNSQTSWMQA